MEITYSNYGAIVINKAFRGQEDTMVYRQPKCRFHIKDRTKTVLQKLVLGPIHFNTRGIKNIGGTSKPLTPYQSTVNASIPVEYIFQYLE
jgi:hypothetical protein